MNAPTELRGSRSFFRLALMTVVAVYFLILVGGIVRATGAGMGCPDWPRCFGQWIPPTDVSQLPDDYQEVYADRGYDETEFNVVKTWTEYVNRLVGVTIGLLIFLTMLSARRFLRVDSAVFWWSVAAFVLVAFQGWLGSVVVSSNLTTWMVTVHMMVALVIVAVLIYVLVRSQTPGAEAAPVRSDLPELWFVSALVLTLVQIVLGTQVREHIDEIARAGLGRSQWIAETGTLTLVHRSFSLLVAAVILVLLWRLSRLAETPGAPAAAHRALQRVVLVVLVGEILAGIVLFYWSVPAVMQPVHLLLAAVLAGALFALWTVWRRQPDSADIAADASPAG